MLLPGPSFEEAGAPALALPSPPLSWPWVTMGAGRGQSCRAEGVRVHESTQEDADHPTVFLGMLYEQQKHIYPV